MTVSTPGIHHVTCIAGDPQRNINFWVETLGLRLVKRSVNQDDPGTYHFFFADAEGTPGTSMTFFPWEGMRQGKVGSGQVARTAFRVPTDSLDYWEARFEEYGVEYQDRVERFGETVLPFSDPDGLPVELVEVDLSADEPTVPWTEFVPKQHAIRGFHSVTLWLTHPDRTADLLREMGLEKLGTEETADGNRVRFAASGPVGKYVDVLPTTQNGRQGHGIVHHVAFQTPTDEDQAAMRSVFQSAGLRPTQQINRHWFRSVYCREFGGVLFELATSEPGYTSDEPRSELGERLVLPSEFEARREEIEDQLVEITVPRAGSAQAEE